MSAKKFYTGELAQLGLVCVTFDLGSNTLIAWNEQSEFIVFVLSAYKSVIQLEKTNSFKLKSIPSSFGEACELALKYLEKVA